MEEEAGRRIIGQVSGSNLEPGRMYFPILNEERFRTPEWWGFAVMVFWGAAVGWGCESYYTNKVKTP